MRMNAGWRPEDERGSVAVIVAISLTVLFGAVAFSVDLGNSWQARRGLVTVTDAAALAGAGEAAQGGNACAAAASYVAANEPDATMTACQTSGGSGAGRVTVSAARDIDYAFAPVLGIAGTTVTSTTTAQFGAPLGVTGLRPIGVCLDNSAVQAWLAAGSPEDGVVHRITYGKDQPSDCGEDVSGNWGLLSFSGAQSNAEFKDVVEHGYDGTIQIGDWVTGHTGSFNNSISDELNTLKGETFTIPIFSSCVASCNGANAQFEIYGFMSLTLVDFGVTGAQQSRYMDVIFRRLTTSGSCCASGGPATGTMAINICATEATDTSSCQS